MFVGPTPLRLILADDQLDVGLGHCVQFKEFRSAQKSLVTTQVSMTGSTNRAVWTLPLSSSFKEPQSIDIETQPQFLPSVQLTNSHSLTRLTPRFALAS